jgi:hypothetical protein
MDKSHFYCHISDLKVKYEEYPNSYTSTELKCGSLTGTDRNRTFFLQVSEVGTLIDNTGIWSIPKNDLVPGQGFTIYVIEYSLKKYIGPDPAVLELRLHVSKTAELQAVEMHCRCSVCCINFAHPPLRYGARSTVYACRNWGITVDVVDRLEILYGRAYNVIEARVTVRGNSRGHVIVKGQQTRRHGIQSTL